MEPLVTVAIPVYNAERTIGIAIKSVLNQSYRNWELLILNDGSTDNSIKIIRSFSDHRIFIYDDQVNRGLIYRLNSIPALANGKYIARMDADDIMHPDRLGKQTAYMERNSGLDIIDCSIYTIDENNRFIGIRNLQNLPSKKIDLLNNCLFTHPAVFGKKDWFCRYLYDFDYYRAEDYELWIRAYDNSIYGRLQVPLLFYREGATSIRNYQNSMKTMRKIIKRYAPSLMSKSKVNFRIAQTYFKDFVFTISSCLRLQRKLVAFRSKSIEPEQEKLLNTIIVQIENVK